MSPPGEAEKPKRRGLGRGQVNWWTSDPNKQSPPESSESDSQMRRINSILSRPVSKIALGLRIKFITLLKEVPFGICVESFVHEFNSKYGYYLDCTTFGYANFVELALKNNDVFIAMRSPLDEQELILYSHEQVDRKQPEDYMRMVWLEILKRFSDVSILEIDSLPSILEENFKVKLNPEHWSFGKAHLYYEYGMQQFSPQIQLIYLPAHVIDTNKASLVKVSRSESTTLKILSEWMKWKAVEEKKSEIISLLQKLDMGKEEQLKGKTLEEIILIPTRAPLATISEQLKCRMSIYAKIDILVDRKEEKAEMASKWAHLDTISYKF